MSPEDARLCEVLRDAADRSGRAQVLIARDARVSEKHLSQVLLGRAAVSLATAARIAAACGHRLVIHVEREDQ